MPISETILQLPARLKHLQAFATRVKSITDTAIKYVSVSGNTISFFKTADGSGVADYTVDFPMEYFLDAANTRFVENFSFNQAEFPGATDPNLEGKPVLVLALKGTDGTTETTSYSFLNMFKLVDTYTVKAGDSSKIININGYEVEFKISAAAGNIIQANNDGIYATTRVANATPDNFCMFDENGAPSDSGLRFCTDAEFTEMLNGVFGV